MKESDDRSDQSEAGVRERASVSYPVEAEADRVLDVEDFLRRTGREGELRSLDLEVGRPAQHGPPPNLAELRARRAEILEVARHHGIVSVRVFGSAVRGEAADYSDLDLLVVIEQGRSLFDLAGFKAELEDLLGHRIDVVEEKGIHWYIRDRVLAEAVPL